MIQTQVLYDDNSGVFLSAISNGGVWALTIALANLFFYRRAISSARRLVLADKANYDAIWQRVLDDSDERQSIENLENWIRHFGRSLKNSSESRHCNRKHGVNAAKRDHQRLSLTLSSLTSITVSAATSRKTSQLSDDVPLGNIILKRAWENLIDCGQPATVDPLNPIHCLNQLYLQAVALYPILIEKVKFWASQSSGYFVSSSVEEGTAAEKPLNFFGSLKARDKPSSPGDESFSAGTIPEGYVRWTDVQEAGTMGSEKVKWCKIKSIQRSIEKSTRSYGKVNNFRHSFQFIKPYQSQY